MERAIKNIADDVLVGAMEIVSADTDYNTKANSITEIMVNGILLVTEQAEKSIYDRYYKSSTFSQLQTLHVEELQTVWNRQMYLFLEKNCGKYSLDEIRQGLRDVINGELYNWYKMAQFQISQETGVEVNFVCHDSACKVCKCMAHNEFVDANILKNDVCDSYFVKSANMMETDNLISNDVKIYNVPKKFKKSISAFYKMVKLKFGDFMKSGIKIKFMSEFDYGDEYKDITDLIDFVYNGTENQFEIRFDPRTYQYYLLKALFFESKPTENMVNLYYSKIKDNVIFPKGCFISYLAEQNENEYYLESLIAYVLKPLNLRSVDKTMFDLIQREVEKK